MHRTDDRMFTERVTRLSDGVPASRVTCGQQDARSGVDASMRVDPRKQKIQQASKGRRSPSSNPYQCDACNEDGLRRWDALDSGVHRIARAVRGAETSHKSDHFFGFRGVWSARVVRRMLLS